MAGNYVTEWRKAVFASDLDAKAKLVALAYAEWAKFDTGGGVRPGTSKVMVQSSLSRASVTRARRRLIADEWMREVSPGSSGKGGNRVAAVYSLTLPTGVTPTPVSETPVSEQHTGSSQQHTGLTQQQTGITVSTQQRKNNVGTTAEQHAGCSACRGTTFVLDDDDKAVRCPGELAVTP